MYSTSDSKPASNKERVIKIMKARLLPEKKLCLSISGFSMSPLLHPGSKVIISTHVNPGQILIGSIIVISSVQQQGIMAHRVIFIHKKNGKLAQFLTKGDGNRCFDKAILPEQILGEIVAIQKENSLINLCQPSWQVAGFLIALSSGISGFVHQWIDRCLRIDTRLFPGTIKSRVCFWSHKISSFAHRAFVSAVILALH